jgi:predicted nucleic acid-binding protein
VTRLAILDTSVFIAVEQERGVSRPLPDQIGVSVVTLAELELGVLVANDSDTRAIRLATMTRLREQTAGIPINDRIASAYARLAARQLANGRRPRVHDTWIAATAIVHDAEVWTQDADFSALEDVDIVRI